MRNETAAGSTVKGDVRVTVSASLQQDCELVINSPVRSLFAAAQDRIVRKTLEDLKVSNLLIRIDDNQALDFALVARIKAAVYLFQAGKV